MPDLTGQQGGLLQHVQTVPHGLRMAVGERWAAAGLAEHASIASFSRFSMHLLGVGAPPELISGAHQGALDEIRHARLCFAIAAAYLGEDVSPGPLPLEGNVLGPMDLASIVSAAVVEGCIGETLSAVEASKAEKICSVPPIQKTLGIIAEDELKHAQLAWQFVYWAHQQDDPSVQEAISSAFDRVIHGVQIPMPQPQSSDEQMQNHGLLGSRAQWLCHQEACDDIIIPAAQHLLAGSKK